MSNTRKLRGKLPNYKIRNLKRDENGIFSGSVLRYFEVGEENQRIDLRWLDPSNAPNPWKLPCTSADLSIEAPMAVVTYSYKGVDSSFQFSREDEITFEIDTSMNEAPIETHPAFQKLKEIYSWDQIQRQFAEFLSKNDSGSNGLNGEQTKGKPSEMFGTDSWLEIGAIYKETFASKTIPGDVFADIGAITQAPPGIKQFRLPRDSAKRNWLKIGPNVSKEGNCVRVTKQWMLSGPKGWLTPVYNSGQLGSSGGSGGGGLSTGGLVTGNLG